MKSNNKRRGGLKRRASLLLIVLGLLLAAAGIGLVGYNLWDDQRAGQEAGSVLEVVVEHIEERQSASEPEPEPEPLDPNREMPTLEVDGRLYIGTIAIPVIDLELPVLDSWSYPLLKVAPCRYKGSLYAGDMIICAHNYTSHFGRLKNLQPGDAVIFTDVEGNVFQFTVKEMETLGGTAVEEMESGDWDLTLFTCTLGGQTRVTVRCELVED